MKSSTAPWTPPFLNWEQHLQPPSFPRYGLFLRTHLKKSMVQQQADGNGLFISLGDLS